MAYRYVGPLYLHSDPARHPGVVRIQAPGARIVIQPEDAAGVIAFLAEQAGVYIPAMRSPIEPPPGSAAAAARLREMTAGMIGPAPDQPPAPPPWERGHDESPPPNAAPVMEPGTPRVQVVAAPVVEALEVLRAVVRGGLSLGDAAQTVVATAEKHGVLPPPNPADPLATVQTRLEDIMANCISGSLRYGYAAEALEVLKAYRRGNG